MATTFAPPADPPATPRVVLVVDDNPANAELTREALFESGVPVEVHVAPNGADALAFVRHERPYAGAPTPDLVLLDLNMPRLDGRAVLAVLKGDDALRDIPVVVLSTSDARRDVASAYHLRANGYVTKPAGLTEFLAAIQTTARFWLQTATPPPCRT